MIIKNVKFISRHAKRTTVSAEDVKLVARRSTALVSCVLLKKKKPCNIQIMLPFICFSQCTYRTKVKNSTVKRRALAKGKVETRRKMAETKLDTDRVAASHRETNM